MRHRPATILAPVAGIFFASILAATGCSSGHYRPNDGPYVSEGYENRDGDDSRFRRDDSRSDDVFALAAELDERSSRIAQMATGHRGQDERHSENDVEELTRKFARRAVELRATLQRESGRGARRKS